MAPLPDRPVRQLDSAREFFAPLGMSVGHIGALWHLLKVAQLVQSDIDRITAAQGISYADFQLLGALMMADPDPVKASELAPALNASHAVLSLRCRRLAAQGLLIREECPQDRRAIPMRITPAGARRVHETAKALERQGQFVQRYNALPQNQRASLEMILRVLHMRLDRDFLPQARKDA
ncbi:MAG: MarR family transcriptional regulator [Novosphingobium sp.]|nr:MarR family transcriptional regulator [Novosphingobium sp.]